MDAKDLQSLLNHFESKIDQINKTIPWARFCNHVVEQHDKLIASPDTNGNTVFNDMPDMNNLSEMMAEMSCALKEMDLHLQEKRRNLQEQDQRIRNLLEDESAELEYLSSNFPIDFGKSPEKPKPVKKYGIDTGLGNRRHTMAPINRKIGTGRPNPNTKPSGPTTGLKNASGAAKTGVNRPTVNGPQSKTGLANKPVTATKTPVRPAPSTVRPPLKEGMAVIGRKSLFPVRMTKAAQKTIEANKKKMG